jgi:predicted amidohydrolase YtcJ
MSLLADLVVINASNIFDVPKATALAVRRGVIERVGSDADVLALAGPETRRVNAAGHSILPGFHDCHLHLLWYGRLLVTQADLVGSGSVEDVLARLAQLASTTEGWIGGHGFDQEKLTEARFPTRDDLDGISRTRPIVISRICGHAVVANSAAIALLDPAERDAGDASTGLYTETAVYAFYRRRPEPDAATLDRALDAAMRVALRSGITSVQTLLDSVEQMQVYTRLRRRLGRLPIRVVGMPPEKEADTLARVGILDGFGDSWLRFGGIKFFADGSLGARTALLSKPYADDPRALGTRIYPRDVLARRIAECHKQGFQTLTHAIGDGALDDVLDAIESALDGADNRTHRHRIEHVSVTRPDQIERLARLRIPVTVQPQFVTSDTWTGQRLGADRAAWAYPFRALIDAGIEVGLSSDCPVERLDARLCLHAATNRHAWTPQGSLGIPEAVRHYTHGSAYLASRELEVGQLRPGMLADFVLIRGDIAAVTPGNIAKLEIARVFINGEEAAG